MLLQNPLANVESLRTGSSISCARCKQPNVAITVRNEHLCQPCFEKYVVTKVKKRIESNKIRAGYHDAPVSLFLPISFGSSSLSLLHILDQHLRYQRDRSGRCSFNLHVLFVDQMCALKQPGYHEAWRSLKERFPSHSYSVAQLQDVFDYDTSTEGEGHIPSLNASNGDASSTQQRLEAFLASLPSPTSRADMISILRARLVTSLAEESGCSSILYGDSTTRLAERTLSETAKGRGGSIPSLTADGDSAHGIRIVYPMRDLLRKEITAYTTITEPPLTSLVLENTSPNIVASSKHSTIDDLMGQYFESVEQNYPSIVTNVVRTSSRLVAPSPTAGSERVCQICRLPLAEGSEGLRWSGEQEHPDSSTVQSAFASAPSRLCYGCARATVNSSQVTR